VTGRETGGGAGAIEEVEADGEKGCDMLTGDALVRTTVPVATLVVITGKRRNECV